MFHTGRTAGTPSGVRLLVTDRKHVLALQMAHCRKQADSLHGRAFASRVPVGYRKGRVGRPLLWLSNSLTARGEPWSHIGHPIPVAGTNSVGGMARTGLSTCWTTLDRDWTRCLYNLR